MIYAVVFLFGGVLMLAWWLFKMEVASGHFISRREWAEERCKDWEQASRNRKQGLDELARALGYEWKRTEAKEGWEPVKIKPFGTGLSGAPYFGCIPPLYSIPWTYRPAAADRRKGDRRKPTIAKAADDPFPSPLDRVVTRKKKPRRAH